MPESISQLRIANLRRHANLTIDLAPLTVLVGPNNVGKSTVMDALNLLSTAARHAPYRFSNISKVSYDALVRTGGDGSMSVGADFDTSEGLCTYDLTMSGTRAGPTVYLEVLDERLVAGGDLQIQRTSSNTDGPLAVPLFPFLRSSTVFGAMNAASRAHVDLARHPAVRSAGEFLRRVGQYRMVAHFLAEPGSAAPSEGFFPNVGRLGHGLTDLLYFLSESHPDAYEIIIDDIGQAIDGFNGFEFGPAEDPQDQQFLAQFSDSRGAVPAIQLSDGTLNLMGLVTILRSPRQFRFLCLEEPEIGLTPKSIAQVVSTLRLGAPTLDGLTPQIVLSTHSPFLVSSVLDQFALEESEARILFMHHEPRHDVTTVSSLEEIADEIGGFGSPYELGPGDIARLMAQVLG